MAQLSLSLLYPGKGQNVDKFFLLTLKHTLTIEHVGRNKYVKNSRSPLETIAPNTCSQSGL